ncbi:hypothetical protein IU449_14870 [Nocardia higoensis]|uniref:Integral membrane protein n=1 Tax=Nocardia higoensis TaxID=228599 RepID=A0ABS0DBH3_9NOCA|nr:hypothetical protein [Nocardia higoensis]MBF6355815.1 hypothetical protein [Nocardia higoensis]
MTRFLAVLAGALLSGGVALLYAPAALPALILVVLGWWFRAAAVAAVLLALAVLTLADVGAVESAALGLVATAYLLNAATVSAPSGVVPTTLPSALGAIGFTACATAAALLPVHLAWAPALAPIVVIALYYSVVQSLAPRRRPTPQQVDPALG